MVSRKGSRAQPKTVAEPPFPPAKIANLPHLHSHQAKYYIYPLQTF